VPPGSDVKLILCDFKLACEDENENIDKYGLHTECNDNGRRLVGFATSLGMMVGGTRFHTKIFIKLCGNHPMALTEIRQTMF
jgi:hypothetical protein